MTPNELQVFLSAIMLLCSVFALVNFVLSARRGPSAVSLGLAFLALGLTVYLYKQRAPVWGIAISGVGVVVLLAIDFALRAAKKKEGGS